MTKHPDATHTATGPAAWSRRPSPGRDRGVSERIYDYISTGHPDRRDHRGARPTPPPGRSA